MQSPTHLRRLVIGLLFLLIVAVWSHSIQTFLEEREELILQLADSMQTIALPYHIARLSVQDPATLLPIPVHGAVIAQVADTWGDLRPGGRTHEGVDIFAARNTPVFAATEGYVIRAGINNLGGRSVFIVGPGGVRYYYAHLERIAEGIKTGSYVTKDTIIGFVGNSGNAALLDPHLHFGVYHRGPQNPYPLLIDRE